MIYDSREVARVRTPALIVTALTWSLLLLGPLEFTMPLNCPMIWAGAATHSTAILSLPEASSILPVASGWVLMLAAMMLPTLVQPIYHVYQRNFSDRRLRAIGSFLAGYGAVWMFAGAVLIPLAIGIDVFASRSYLRFAVTLMLAIAWQFSPIKQRSLNRCHAHTALAVFGVASDVSAFLFGAKHGLWCFCSCWALMLCAITLPQDHLLGMGIASILIFSERLEKPQVPRWRVRGLGKSIRILRVESARISLRA